MPIIKAVTEGIGTMGGFGFSSKFSPGQENEAPLENICSSSTAWPTMPNLQSEGCQVCEGFTSRWFKSIIIFAPQTAPTPIKFYGRPRQAAASSGPSAPLVTLSTVQGLLHDKASSDNATSRPSRSAQQNSNVRLRLTQMTRRGVSLNILGNIYFSD